VVTIVTGVFFLILTVQKQRSLVLFRAIGAGRRDVVAPVLIQVLFVVGIGCLLGTLVAGLLLNAARETFGSALDPRTTVLTIGFLLILGVLASVGAVRRVLAIDPIEATTAGTV
ncbi:MAG: FtsX-like permease family protein, partial [Actinomycetota bacterium]